MKKNITLLVVAAVLVGVYLFMSGQERAVRKPAGEVGKLLLPGFEKLLTSGDIQGVRVARGEETVTIELGEKEWKVKELFGYPADFGRLQRVLTSLTQVKVGQVLPGAKLDTAETTEVTWLDKGGQSLGGVRLGQTRQAPAREDSPWGGGFDGRQVARPDSESVYLVSESLSEFATDAKSWVDTQILSVTSSDVEEVTIEHPDGEVVKLSKEGGQLTLEGLAENEEFDTSKRYGVSGALSYLRFTDLADPELSDEVSGFSTGVVYRATSSKGQIYEVRVGNKKEDGTDRYARFGVSLKEAEAEEAAEDEDDEAKAAREKRQRERVELERSTAELHEKLSPWVFCIASGGGDNMSMRRAGLVKEKKVEEKKEEEKEEVAAEKQEDQAAETKDEVAEAAGAVAEEVQEKVAEKVETVVEAVQEAVAEKAEKAEAAVQKATEAVQEKVPEAEAVVEEVKEVVEEKVQETQAPAEKAVEKVAEKVETVVEAVQEAVGEKAEAAVQKAVEAVQEKVEKAEEAEAEKAAAPEEV